MKDETYVFIQDVKEKKITARSARNTRTHNGKSGRVKLPCDYLTPKELKAMNGECKSYRLNEPMSWTEFKAMPDDIKVTYIKLLREKFDVPDSEIYKMFGTNKDTLSRFFKALGLRVPRKNVKREWKKDEWFAWVNGVEIKTADPKENTTVYPDSIIKPEDMTAPADEPEMIDECACEEVEEIRFSKPPVPDPEVPKFRNVENKTAVPVRGELTFSGSAEAALNTAAVLLGGANVRISLLWEVISDEVQ